MSIAAAQTTRHSVVTTTRADGGHARGVRRRTATGQPQALHQAAVERLRAAGFTFVSTTSPLRIATRDADGARLVYEFSPAADDQGKCDGWNPRRELRGKIADPLTAGTPTVHTVRPGQSPWTVSGATIEPETRRLGFGPLRELDPNEPVPYTVPEEDQPIPFIVA